MSQPLDFLPQNLDHVALLRAIFAAHFMLTNLVLLGSWAGTTYAFYNGFLLVGLLWALSVSSENSELPLMKVTFVNAFAIVMDILTMCGYSVSAGGKGGWEGFSLAMAVLNLGLRLPTTAFLYRIYCDRQRQSRYESHEGGGAAQQQSLGSSFGAPFTHHPPPSAYDTDYDTRPIAP